MKALFIGFLAFIVIIPLSIIFIATGASASNSYYCGPIATGESLPQGHVLDQEKLGHAVTIVNIGEELNVPPEGLVIGLAVALTESALQNLTPEESDPGSAGLFQQRPDQGWGTWEQVQDPEYAVRAFFGDGPNKGLLEHEGWEDMTPVEAAHDVQVSDFPERVEIYLEAAQGIYQTVTGVDASSCTAGFGEATGVYATIRMPAGGTTQMDISAAQNMQNLVNAAAEDGVLLGGWGLRTHQRQHELRRTNGCPNDGSWTHSPIENPASWAGANSCRVPTAKPGFSKHESGLAMDFTYNGQIIGSRSGVAWDWLFANAHKFGFKNLPSEPWHWSTTGG